MISMDVILGNQLNQSQQLNLTPKIIEELKILQMSNLEFEQYIEDAMVDNPLLEDEESCETIDNLIGVYEEERYNNEDDDIDSENKPDFSDYTHMGISLKEHLMTQLKELKLEPQVRKAAAYIIENIDAQGYFRLSIAKSARRINISVNDMKKALRCVQDMEPSGVGARNLKECLIIQLKNIGIYNDLTRNIIANHLEAIGERKLKYELIHIERHPEYVVFYSACQFQTRFFKNSIDNK